MIPEALHAGVSGVAHGADVVLAGAGAGGGDGAGRREVLTRVGVDDERGKAAGGRSL